MFSFLVATGSAFTVCATSPKWWRVEEKCSSCTHILVIFHRIALQSLDKHYLHCLDIFVYLVRLCLVDVKALILTLSRVLDCLDERVTLDYSTPFLPLVELHPGHLYSF